MFRMRAREGDLIRNINNVIFDVKGLQHPPDKVIAFPRYIPNLEGPRGQQGARYDKIYNLQERFMFLQRVLPHLLVGDPVFGEKLCEVPTNEITKHYDPIRALARLRRANVLEPLQEKAVALAEDLKEAAGIPWRSIGISGSVMAGLFIQQSDIDPLVYGVENSRKANTALVALREDTKSKFKKYKAAELQALFDFRSKDTTMSFEDFELVETRKGFQGMYDGTDYFVRFIRDWNEVSESYGDVVYEYAGYVKASASVIDDSEALFTPCTYKLSNVQVLSGEKLEPIEEIASFRGRFCEQAKAGEKVLVQGKVEKVTDRRMNRSYYRFIIGNKPADYMTLLKV